MWRLALELFYTHHADIEGIPQRSGLGPGECHPGEVGSDAGIDILRRGVRSFHEGATIRKLRRGFGQSQAGIDADEVG